MGLYKHGFNVRNNKGSIERRFYDRWQNMKTRCSNSNRKDWNNYGGRGIKIESSWDNFSNFVDDMYLSFREHVKQHGSNNTTLDRIDVNKNYSKDNCRWATKKEQAQHKRKVIMTMYDGKLQSLADVARQLDRSYQTMHSRLKRGMLLNAPFRSRVPKS